ncbi:PAS domain-containing hybrid sensor histidine kinase/response regulator [Halocynthiibacter namhaensis]|uniref:PAS domain-containing hybrid sensor histidine kinase/response regulator n=1 Tax=Halocynthiibacter namhaensis TaxID=1290553 RepID=UPI00068CFBD6|nr:ATP-binding protein [Halocynthiibacter namhaensis]
MSSNNESAQEALICFDLRNSSDGLFLRYARGYLAALPIRIVMFTLAGILLGLITTPMLAIVSYTVVIFGEGIHSLSLLKERSIPISNYRGSRNQRDVQRATAAFQAICSSIGVAIIWTATDTGDTRFFAFVCVTTLVIHASITLPFFPWGSKLRLGIYSLLLCILVLTDLMQMEAFQTGLGFDLSAIILFSCMATMLMISRHKNFRNTQAAKRQLLHEKLEVEEARDRLIESENLARQLALVARNASDIVVITEPDGTITWVNNAFHNSTGFADSDVIGRNVRLLNGPQTDTKIIQQLVQARAKSQPVRVEILNYNKHGETKWYEISVSPIFDDMGIVTHFVSIERDIHAVKQRETDLASAREAAEQTARAKTEFLATMSHEIRTPMNGIIGVSDLLLESHLSKDQRHLTETISEAAAALLTIINNTLDLTQLDANKIDLETHEFDPKSLAEKTVELLQPIATGKGVALKLNCDKNVPQTILSDSGRLRQILLNLVGNALKFTSEGQVTCHLQHVKTPDQCKILIDISDTGIGIATDKLNSIFEEFSQADSSVSRRFGGTGLGLSISRQLARVMGGDITVSSQEGTGSIFTLALPYSQHQPLGLLKDDHEDVQIQFAGKSVLIADDNKTNRFILSRLLQETGISLEFATDGFEVVNQFRHHKPDLILMDVSMPGKDGLEATREIRELEKTQDLGTVPIYALTANAFSSHRDDCVNAGMNGFLTKPVKRDVLVGTLEEIFATGSGHSYPS